MARKLLGLLVILLLVVIVLIYTGWINFSTQGQLTAPDIDVTGGELPSVEMNTKEVVVGTENRTVEVPVVTTEERTIQVPTVGTTEEKAE